MSTSNGSSSQATSRTFNAQCSRCRSHTVGPIEAVDEVELDAPIITRRGQSTPLEDVQIPAYLTSIWCRSCAEEMERMCKSILAELQNPSKDDPIHECGQPNLPYLLDDMGATERLFKLANEKLHVFPFSAVKECWRRLYTDTSIAKALKKVPAARIDIQYNPMPETQLDEVVSILDMALIMAGGSGRQEMIHKLLKELEYRTERAQELFPRTQPRDVQNAPNGSRERPAKRRKRDLQPNTFHPGPLTKKDYGGGNTANEEDWASIGAAGLKAQRSPSSGVDHPGFVLWGNDTSRDPRLQSPIPEKCNRSSTASDSPPAKVEHNKGDLLPAEVVSVPSIKHPVVRLKAPTLPYFQKYMDNLAKPLLMTEIMRHWPALDRWKSKTYWLNKTFRGRRLVPIEIGRSYADDDWSQEIVPFRTFLNDYILARDLSGSSPLASPPGLMHESDTMASEEEKTPQSSAENGAGNDSTDDERRTGYLAQHDLLSQIPSLRADIATPDYCFLDAPPPKEGTPVALKLAEGRKKESNHLAQQAASDPLEGDINSPDDGGPTNNIQNNIWFGPAWTISPLHHDPYHNILCQVVGKKYVRLYAPEDSHRLYPKGWEEAPGNRDSARELADGGKVHGMGEGAAVDFIDNSNNSNIDVTDLMLSPAEDWDAVYPGISEVPYVECVLEAGEALYIPVGWWHYVRSCSVGISVSFWW